MITLARRILRYARSPDELRLLLAMAAVAAVLPALLKQPLPRTLRTLDWINRRLVRHPGRTESVLRYAAALGRLHWWSFQDNCVARNLLYYVFLNSPERPVEVRFGVEQRRTPEGAIVPGRRHVWIVRDGEPVNETVNLEDYVLLYCHPPRQSA